MSDISVPDNFINNIFNYTTSEFIEIEHAKDVTCEDICIKLSKRFGILPSSRLLFGLRVYETQNWLAPCRPLKPAVKYEFRLRFKVPQHQTLRKLDECAFDYFYHQMRNDLVNGKIDEIKYPAYKDQVLGLGVVDMYIDMIERSYTIEDLESNYKKYIPKQLIKNHHFFAKRKISKGLRDIKKKDHDLLYVKGTYLHSISTMAPNHLIEEYKGSARYLPEDDLGEGTCPVVVQFNPFHETEPGVRVYYKYKDEWKHISKLENIYALYREDKFNLRLELSSSPNGYRLGFPKPAELKSFVTCVAGYYRLSVQWMQDLCVQFATPSLKELKALKYHGPIGGDFSYGKIREKNNKPGSYIIRQCEQEFDTFYIDINTRGSHTETFKITRECNQWHLHLADCTRSFDKLTELALSIDTSTDQKFRIPPSEYDKPPLLLICLPRNQLTAKKTVSELSEAELQQKRVQIFDPKIDLQWYKNSQKDCEGGKMFEMRADWVLPSGDKQLKVTLKILKSDKHFNEFMKLAERWSRMYSSEFVKLYGLTLSTPHTMVLEYSRFGPLNEFLNRLKDKVSLACLLEAVYNLVRAMVYLQSNCIFHGYIRCASLQVMKFDSKMNTLIVKLADPGFPRPYKAEDLPWIPLEYHRNLEAAKRDQNAELWAFATTVWEIFSRGRSIEKLSSETLWENHNRLGGILPTPDIDCPDDMYMTMLDGWSYDPDKRFNQQLIFSRLASIKSNSGNYSTVDQNTILTSLDASSIGSVNTDHTVNGASSGSDIRSLNSYSDYSLGKNSFTSEKTPLIQATNNQNNATTNNIHQFYANPSNYFDDTPSVVRLKSGKLTYRFSAKIGEGHYGTVFRGEMYFYNNGETRKVAIKTLKTCDRRDFMREIQIMEKLTHRNIVKIYEWFPKPLGLVMEYVECGSFIVYLSSQKPNLTNEKLLDFALDIANGMEYLRSKNVIHRDLAARNILVDHECVKISDFGLAQIADSDGYYFVKSDREIPIKWYSPETIKTNKFSFQSDVWSYGVTLFEMFSRGETPDLDPNRNLSQVEILEMLENNVRLRKPAPCPDIVYDKLMMPCWHANPKSRPDFKQILDTIKTILDESGESI